MVVRTTTITVEDYGGCEDGGQATGGIMERERPHEEEGLVVVVVDDHDGCEDGGGARRWRERQWAGR